MKTKLLLSVLAGTLSSSAFAAAMIDPALATFARSTSARPTRVIVLLDLPRGTEVAPRRYDRVRTVQYLRQRGARALRTLQSDLSRARVSTRDVRIGHLFPLSLSVSADVTPAGLRALAQSPLATKIYLNQRLGEVKSLRGRPVRRFVDGLELPYHFETSGLNRLIKDFPQITGQGVVVGHIDTGVDDKHPALAGKVIAFYDGSKRTRTDKPFDSGRHGTHTAGTILGGKREGENQIGVAPEAKMIAAGALGDYEEMLKAMEFMIDPDGKPSTNDQPRLVSNSWNSGGAPDQEPFYRAISAWEASGILTIFSAGNAGPDPSTITPPHEHPEAFAVAASDKDLKIADFSSRGPGRFRGQDTQKPDITAPGVDVYSALPGGIYGNMSGTSMATPQVAGAATLMYQANPNLNPTQMRAILVKSSIPVSADGTRISTHTWNPNFGMGHLDIAAAVKMALDLKDGRDPFGIGRATGGGFFTLPRDLERDALAAGTARRSIDESWQLAREASSPAKWLTLDDLN